MNDRTALILGAHGRFGRAAVAAFVAAGWRTLAQSRKASPGLPAGAQALVGDLADLAGLAGRAAGASIVVHAANPPYDRWDAEMLPLAEQAIALAAELRATLMLPGNVYGYGEAMPAVLAEHTPMQPSTAKGRLRVALEDALRTAARDGRIPGAVVIRAGDFFGSGTGSWLDLAVLKSLARGRLVYPGPLDRMHAWAYLPDLARAFAAVAGCRQLRPYEHIHFPGHALTGAALLDAVEGALRKLGRMPRGGLRRADMPWLAMRLGAPFVPMLREVLAMRYLWNVPHALAGKRLTELVGALPGTPIDEAMLAAVRDLTGGPGR
jgi:nucleoside-diphosphate-sugar epimerase